MVIAGGSRDGHRDARRGLQHRRARSASRSPAFDVNSACTSFLAQLHLLSLDGPEALPPFVLLVVPEALTRARRLQRPRDRRAVGRRRGRRGRLDARARAARACSARTLASQPVGAATRSSIPRTGHFRQEGRAVQAFAIKKTRRGCSQRAARTTHASDGRTLHFVGHQANLRMLEAVCRECGIAPSATTRNVEWFGNTGGAERAVGALDALGQVDGASDDVAVVGVGAGLTWSSYLLRFEAAA